ncbi:hypothetical protein TRFO_36308 [Tritrichomonas foetus]|uniref:Uncharacterized protein n=1 Tax=Tritrichomonas foetus TaxID=1144522 RepID=A0A1J4JIV8_9EUKA|nr:hypothetical protein TRFO_36308 [Tritrichomonas foetus]|eukprot:OHS97485.1 hypothetical protein TRFO_36308 [Tritrichomonas foetus]
MIFIFGLLIISKSTSFVNISLKANEKQIINLNESLFVYISSYGFRNDDLSLTHASDEAQEFFDPSFHHAFRGGSLEISAKKNISLQAWLLPSTKCPYNNYVISPHLLTVAQFNLPTTSSFCIFSHMNLPYSGLMYEADVLSGKTTASVMTLGADTPYVLQNQKMVSIMKPFFMEFTSSGTILGRPVVNIFYAFSKGICSIAKINEKDKSWPEIHAFRCQKYKPNFSIFLVGLLIVAGFAVILTMLIYKGWINLKTFWYPNISPGANIQRTERIEEHLEIEETPEPNETADQNDSADENLQNRDAAL